MNGIECFTALKALPLYDGASVVMMTAREDVEVRHRALEEGGADFITRPIDTIEVKSRIKNLLSLREAQIKLTDKAEWLASQVALATSAIAAREEESVARLCSQIAPRNNETS